MGVQFLQFFAEAACNPKTDFFGLPTWYKYLPGKLVIESGTGKEVCQPLLGSINDFWLVAAAIIDLLLRAGALIAIGYIVVGGVRYIISLGEPDKTKQARGTIIHACVGLAISIVASVFVNYFTGLFQ